ncbi:aldehyde dehydrogenase family protein [Rhodococcus opacus]|uniref:Aldehyde dehydrogenase n=1 Tax=Rhodococcus opacus (strain B4) TaxID=632772 RepID=C1AY32_RHOOB|nr:aldehyde dehydrogenase family protein [Rhodococcus opacus]BAH54027.1 aldehyde dehydrogenase [Rhodococcus opacus B4]
MTTTMHTAWDRDSILVGGDWIPVPDGTDVHDPATEAVIGRSASAGLTHVEAAVAAARSAGTTWGASTPELRAATLENLCAELRARRQLLVDTTVAEVGAPVTVAEDAHIDLGIEILESYARLARDLPFREQLGHSLLLRRPAGVVACITPWNYPFYQLAAKVGAALAAGCTTVVKPAELTPLSTYLFADAALAAGLPPGVLNVVPGSGRTVGAALAGHPGVDVVSFTGSTAVGRGVAHAAAESLKRACLELGGKSASVVLDDAPLAGAVTATVDAAMLNSGQTCSAWTRLLVPRDWYEESVALAADHADTLRVGDPRDRATQLGPVISAAQRRSIAETVDAAIAGGARLAAGGTGRPAGLGRGHYLRPTVIADVGPHDPIVREEVFGPVLVVLPHDGDEDAVRLANDSEYGLGGAVWSADPERALGVAARMDTGQVDINGAAFNPEAPFGGWKSSGLGRELGRAGVEEFTELTSVQR